MGSFHFKECRVEELHSNAQIRAARSQNWASARVNLQSRQKKNKKHSTKKKETCEQESPKGILIECCCWLCSLERPGKFITLHKCGLLVDWNPGEKNQAWLQGTALKKGYELNMEAHKCNQPYVWLPAATPNQLIGQRVSQVTRAFFFFEKTLLLC